LLRGPLGGEGNEKTVGSWLRDSTNKSFLLLFFKKEVLPLRVQTLFAVFLERQRGRFVLFPPVFLAGGMLAYFSLTAEPSLPVAAALAAAAIVLTALAWRHILLRAGLLCATFAAIGFALACLATWTAPPWPGLPRRAVIVSGRIAALDLLPEGRRITIAAPSLDGAPSLPRALRLRLRVTDPALLAPGDTVSVRALLRAPSPPDYPGGWDTQREAFFAGLAGYGFAIAPAVRLTAAGQSMLAPIRNDVASRLISGLPGPDGAIAATLLTGLGSAIPPGDRAAFQQSGLAHLLAVAGLHIGIVMGLVFATCRFVLAAWERAALYWPTRQIAAVAALGAGAGYLMLTGAHIPIIRSFAMAGLVTLGVLTGRRAISLRGLALAAVLLVVLSPASIVSAGFQMSFASVLTLIAGYELARPALAGFAGGKWWRGPALYAAGLVLTSALAGTASLPFAAYHFGNATPYYIPANMAAVPITAIWVMPWGLAALMLMPLGLERIALVPMGWGIWALRGIAHWVASWPDAVIPVPQMPAWCLALIAAGMVWAGLWRGRLRLAGAVPILIGLAGPLARQPPDILVTPNAGIIALRLGNLTKVVASPGATAFEAEAPLRVWGQLPAGTPCSQAPCRLGLRGARIQLAAAEDQPDCAAELILSAQWLHAACDHAAILDRATVADGPAEAWLAPIHILTDRDMRGDRPWVIHARTSLPFAPTE